jgi:hypothetical protein
MLANLSLRDPHLCGDVCRVHQHVPVALNIKVWPDAIWMQTRQRCYGAYMANRNTLPDGDGSIRNAKDFRKTLGCTKATDDFHKGGVSI